ncbi:MAG: hypothetical protein AAF709_19080 [Pseudomonadota bacterium]
MGQELVKFNGATGIVERPEYSLALSARTPNQERLRELINGEVAPEESRFYHPPNLEFDELGWNSEVAGNLAQLESSVSGTETLLADDPKACWTGFAFGIACAAVIGGAFFLSIAAVVTPQPSIAALVPIEVEKWESKVQNGNQVASRSAVILPQSGSKQLESTDPKISTSTIWQELRRFHASAGKFSQPRILLVSSPTPKNLIDGGLLNERKASLSKPQLEPVALAEQTKSSDGAESNGVTQLMPRIINAVSEPIVPEKNEASVTDAPIVGQSGDNAQTTASQTTDSKSDHAELSHMKGVNISEDTLAAATSGAEGDPTEKLPTATAESGPITTASKQIKVIKSSLTPTARTKVRLAERRKYSIVGSKARKSALKAAKLAKKKRGAQQYNFFKIQVRPDWAETAFTQSSQ